jgi:hypothetical protein
VRPDPKAASRLLEDGEDRTCLMFFENRFANSIDACADPFGIQRTRQEEKINSSGPHTVSLGKIPSALPLLGEALATADSPGLSGSVERIDFTGPNGEQQGRITMRIDSTRQCISVFLRILFSSEWFGPRQTKTRRRHNYQMGEKPVAWGALKRYLKNLSRSINIVKSFFRRSNLE